jgi:hypothetical protein
MSRGPWRVALVATFTVASPVVGAWGSNVQESDPERPSVEVVGACPEGAAVRRLLTELVTSDEAGAGTTSIQDQGSRYRIVVGAEATTLYDPARDCGARARQAAVVVASRLRWHPQVFGPPGWTVEKGVVFDVASGAGGPVWAPGAEIRGAYGTGRWSLVGAAGARAPVTLLFDDLWKAELLRFPLDAGPRLTVRWWRLRAWAVVGASLTLTGILGEELLEADREWRLDPGALAMLGATLPVYKRIGVAAAISARWQPRPYQLRVTPVGEVGETPRWWFGLSLNYTFDGKPTSP